MMNTKQQLVLVLLVLAGVLGLTQLGLGMDDTLRRSKGLPSKSRALGAFNAMGSFPVLLAVLAVAVHMLMK